MRKKLTLWAAFLLAFKLGLLPCRVNHVGAEEPRTREYSTGEYWSGFAATENSWYVYSGSTYAPFDILAATGFRLRVMGGYGGYYYDSTLNVGGNIFALTFSGETRSLEALVGYQFRQGAWTGKLFAGLDYQEHIHTPFDPSNDVAGAETGFKLIAENWINLGPDAWASLDGSYSTAFNSYNLALKAAHNLIGPIDLGVELGGYGNKTLNAARAGLLMRYRGELVEISMTGGVAGDYDKPSNPYGSITALTKF